MEAQQSTPSDTYDHTGQENPAQSVVDDLIPKANPRGMEQDDTQTAKKTGEDDTKT